MQEELLGLKRTYGHSLHLKKAPAGATNSPFPLLISNVLDPPAEAEAYDVSSIKVAESAESVVAATDQPVTANAWLTLCTLWRGNKTTLFMQVSVTISHDVLKASPDHAAGHFLVDMFSSCYTCDIWPSISKSTVWKACCT